jgi:hypothetical protein
MARKGRYTEARIYVAGGSVALLLGVWGLLAAQDAHSRAVAANATPTPAPIFAPQPTPGTSGHTQSTAAPQPAQRTHSRTHGS